jgi:hypothetical protein
MNIVETCMYELSSFDIGQSSTSEWKPLARVSFTGTVIYYWILSILDISLEDKSVWKWFQIDWDECAENKPMKK